MYVNWVRSAELLLHHTEILDHITQTMDNPKLSKKRTNRNNRHSWHWVATKKDYLAIMKKFLHPLLDKKKRSHWRNMELCFRKFHRTKVAKPWSVFPVRDFPPRSMYARHASVRAMGAPVILSDNYVFVVHTTHETMLDPFRGFILVQDETPCSIIHLFKNKSTFFISFKL